MKLRANELKPEMEREEEEEEGKPETEAVSVAVAVAMAVAKNESGEADWIFMLVVIVFFQLWQLTLLVQAAEKWSEAYQGLEDSAQRPLSDEAEHEFLAFGQSWAAPLPRIDYGAHYSKEKDAKAICLVGRAMLLESDLQKYRCE